MDTTDTVVNLDMAILCHFDDYWYLAHFSSEKPGLWSVSCGAKMPNHGGFMSVNNYIGRNMDSIAGVTFYPEIAYNNAKLYPECWTTEATEPLLRCRLMGWDAQSAGYSHEQQKADGWKGVGSGDGATKWIHVDDLEKIEGPPPDGPF